MPFTDGRHKGRNNFNRDSERNQQSHFGHVKVEIPNRNRTGDMGS